jgi:hypothetical protein
MIQEKTTFAELESIEKEVVMAYLKILSLKFA